MSLSCVCDKRRIKQIAWLSLLGRGKRLNIQMRFSFLGTPPERCSECHSGWSVRGGSTMEPARDAESRIPVPAPVP